MPLRLHAHITALRSDGVLPELLGMTRIVSEDAVRRGLKNITANDGASWLQRHIDKCTYPLLSEPYILDIDTTVKPLYGHQEDAVEEARPPQSRASHLHGGGIASRHGRRDDGWQRAHRRALRTRTGPSAARQSAARCGEGLVRAPVAPHLPTETPSATREGERPSLGP